MGHSDSVSGSESKALGRSPVAPTSSSKTAVHLMNATQWEFITERLGKLDKLDQLDILVRKMELMEKFSMMETALQFQCND